LNCFVQNKHLLFQNRQWFTILKNSSYDQIIVIWLSQMTIAFENNTDWQTKK